MKMASYEAAASDYCTENDTDATMYKIELDAKAWNMHNVINITPPGWDSGQWAEAPPPYVAPGDNDGAQQRLDEPPAYAEASKLPTPESVRGGKDATSSKCAVILPNQLWHNIIYVQFILGETPERVAAFKEAAQKVQQYAHIEFKFTPPPSGQVAQLRVSFNDTNRWESAIGTEALGFPEQQATMHLSITTMHSAKEESLTIHELMHFLGFDHEHASPNANIEWKERIVLEHFENYYDWDEEMVKANLFHKHEKKNVWATQRDPYSLLNYNIRKEWTSNDFTAEQNEELSATDKWALKIAYPRARRVSSPL
jgi:Astacin (Peptidase family M12A)